MLLVLLDSHWFKGMAKTKFSQEAELLDHLAGEWAQGRDKREDLPESKGV